MEKTKRQIGSIKGRLTKFSRTLGNTPVRIWVEKNKNITVGVQGTSKWYGFYFDEIDDAMEKAKELNRIYRR